MLIVNYIDCRLRQLLQELCSTFKLDLPFRKQASCFGVMKGSVLCICCLLEKKTRMVQLPATAAIEYVAACCRTRTWTRMKTGTKTKIGTITKTVRGAYARSPQVQCVYAPSRLSVPSVIAWRTNKQTDKLGLLAPQGVDPRSPNFLGM